MLNLNILEKISQIYKSEKPTVISALCAKNKSPRVKCGQCAVACPHKAVKFKKPSSKERTEQNCTHYKIEITEACTDCGFCTAVCPAGALTNASATFPPLKAPLPETLLIGCHLSKTELANCTNAVQVFCPGRIDENDVLALSLAGVRNFIVYIGRCENCRYWRGISLFSEKLFFAGSITRQFGITIHARFDAEIGTAAETGVNPATPAAGIDRREFMGALKNKAVGATVKLAAGLLEKKGTAAMPKKNLKRKRFLDILAAFAAQRAQPSLDKIVFERKTNLDFVGFPEVNGSCTGCDVCSKLCPADALQWKHDGGDKSLHLDARHCIACGICETFCRAKAITVRKEGAIDFVNLNCGSPQLQSLISLFNHHCPDCGMDFYAATKNAKCIFC